MVNTICRLLHIGKSTYYKYKKENYPIINFLHMFDKDDLIELEQTGIIKKLTYTDKILSNMLHEYKLFFNELLLLDSVKNNDITSLSDIKKTIIYNYFSFVGNEIQNIAAEKFKIHFAHFLLKNVDSLQDACYDDNFSNIFNINERLINTIKFLAETDFKLYNMENCNKIDFTSSMTHHIYYQFYKKFSTISDEQFSLYYEKFLMSLSNMKKTYTSEITINRPTE